MKQTIDMNSVLPVGKIFEKYTVQKRLGHGGMGTVYLVKHNLLDALFALKTLHPAIAVENPGYVSRFIREAKLACKIKHPNLIGVHDAGQNTETGIYYIVMDYVSGGNARNRLNKIKYFSLSETLRIITGIASALKAAHQFGIVHRDIKPENIMFDGDGTVKLADLGIAKITNSRESSLTMTSSVFGTPAYMSPEQAKDSSKVDFRADIFSLGIVFYEMLSGQRPFKGKTTVEIVAQLISNDPIPDIRTICPNIPDNVACLIADMVNKDVDKRIQSSDELLNRLKIISAEIEKQSTKDQAELQEEKTTVRVNPDQIRRQTVPTLPIGERNLVSDASAAPESAITEKADDAPEAPAVPMEDDPEETASAPQHSKRKIIIAAAAGIAVLLLLSVFFILLTGEKTESVQEKRNGVAVISVDTIPQNTPETISAGKSSQPGNGPKQDSDNGSIRPPAHSIVILGPADSETKRLAERLKKEMKNNIVRLDFESVSRLREQIQMVVQSQPDMVVMLPVRHFSGSGISLANFEMLFSESVEPIREKNIPLLILSGPVVSRKEKDFYETVKNVCARRSLNFKSVDEKITLP